MTRSLAWFAGVGLLAFSATVAAQQPMVPSTTALQPAPSAADATARTALDAYGACVAERHPRESLRVLSQDFTSSTYRTGLQMLAQTARRECARGTIGRGNAMTSGGLLFAGAVAENLIEDGEGPLNSRLARMGNAAAPTFGPTDAIAQCLARSLPDDVARLFATAPGTPEEATAATPLTATVEPCAQATGSRQRIELGVAAMRAMVATAALRLLNASGNSDA